MGNTKKPENKSRRQFFSSLLQGSGSPVTSEKVKMLTAEGKLVEIDRSVLDAATRNKKSSNQEIYDWMINPSKKHQ